MNECEKEKRRMVKAANLQAHSVFRQLLVMFAEAVNSATRATILLYIITTSIITSIDYYPKYVVTILGYFLSFTNVIRAQASYH